MRDRLKTAPRIHCTNPRRICRGLPEKKLLVPRRLGELNGAAISQAEVSAHRY